MCAVCAVYAAGISARLDKADGCDEHLKKATKIYRETLDLSRQLAARLTYMANRMSQERKEAFDRKKAHRDAAARVSAVERALQAKQRRINRARAILRQADDESEEDIAEEKAAAAGEEKAAAAGEGQAAAAGEGQAAAAGEGQAAAAGEEKAAAAPAAGESQAGSREVSGGSAMASAGSDPGGLSTASLSTPGGVRILRKAMDIKKKSKGEKGSKKANRSSSSSSSSTNAQIPPNDDDLIPMDSVRA
jgi:hypothetical protein